LEIENIRRANLEALIAKNYKNKRQFCLKHTFNYGSLYSTLKGERPFGERLAREIEARLGLEQYVLDKSKSELLTEARIPEYHLRLSAGNGCRVWDEEVKRHHLMDRFELKNMGWHEETLCIFTVVGDSMLPEIHEGNRVIVDTSATVIIDNKIYAICVNGEIFIKRLFKDIGNNRILVRSDNQAYPDKYLTLNEEFIVVGRVVYLLGKLL
jgi:phage repressor protein C with HTH and peptisase S24 domain